ncbi:MAG TPA: M20/M25/M40 family metallo-hydrolase [Thermoplasmata archaeon]|nr:M20/M25/M40 family metallo-hydrolase [Thermoplasmata archaeon]
MDPSGPARDHATVVEQLGDPDALTILQELVAIAPTNLEDLASGRFEKPNYRRATDAIVRWARSFGLATRVFDPLVEGPPQELHGVPRPNVIIDLDRGARETVLVLAHYDVVPVPAEQRSRWRTPPHTLTLRPDGRLGGRGANDDLGSGITATLVAMRRLAASERLHRNVRLLACCDEETGGTGGIEALREHDGERAPDDPERLVRGDVALIPDGSPHTTIGSSGVAFLEAERRSPTTVRQAVAAGRTLVGLHALAAGWRSPMRSPDWPERSAPEPVITGRATVTKLDLAAEAATASDRLGLRAVHAESDAANQIARVVTIVLDGSPAALAAAPERLAALVAPPFRLEPDGATALTVPPGALALQLVGVAAHGGYPHRGHNPVPATLELLEAAVGAGILEDGPLRRATYTVDLRLPPEMELADGTERALAEAKRSAGADAARLTVTAPPSRCRPGYALDPRDPSALRLETIVRAELGEGGLFGEYGGTDASSLRGLRTPGGAPMPALVFGSMDPAANIHDVDESADPRLIAGVARTIERFVLEA